MLLKKNHFRLSCYACFIFMIHVSFYFNWWDIYASLLFILTSRIAIRIVISSIGWFFMGVWRGCVFTPNPNKSRNFLLFTTPFFDQVAVQCRFYDERHKVPAFSLNSRYRSQNFIGLEAVSYSQTLKSIISFNNGLRAIWGFIRDHCGWKLIFSGSFRCILYI